MRRRPPKQGELRTDVSKATMFQGDGAANRVAAGNQKGGLLPEEAAKRKKDLIGLERICCLGALNRGLQNLEASLKRF